MPGRTRTGPFGRGPRTGRGWGDCSDADDPRPRGGARGWRGRGGHGFGWRHRFWAAGNPGWWRADRWDAPNDVTEAELLQARKRDLEAELMGVRRRLEGIDRATETEP